MRLAAVTAGVTVWLWAAGARSQEAQLVFDSAHAAKFEVGDVTVIVGDHYAHGGSDRTSYTGIHHFSHKRYPHDVFCPLYAGLIGLRRECRFEKVGDNGVTLSVGEGTGRVSETYVVKPPCYVDHTARFTAGGSACPERPVVSAVEPSRRTALANQR